MPDFKSRFTPISPQKAHDLQARLKGDFISPEHNLACILGMRYKRGQTMKRFHFISLLYEDKVYLFDYMRRPFGSAPKTNKGLASLHKIAVRIFLDAKKQKIPRDGGFCFDFYVGLRAIDITLDVDVARLELERDYKAENKAQVISRLRSQKFEVTRKLIDYLDSPQGKYKVVGKTWAIVKTTSEFERDENAMRQSLKL